MSAQQPIGIFDSGIGGLTVAAAISGLLPQEQIIYFGDTAHVPYGDKSVELISSYAERITNFLLTDKACKAIVIACNTASAAAYATLRDKYKGSVPVPLTQWVLLQQKQLFHPGCIRKNFRAENLRCNYFPWLHHCWLP